MLTQCKPGCQGLAAAHALGLPFRARAAGWRWLGLAFMAVPVPVQAWLRTHMLMLVLAAATAATAAPAARAAPAAPAACPGGPLPLQPVADGVWWLPSATGDSNAANRGQVSNLVLVRAGPAAAGRLWAVGSGPSPAWGRRLACEVHRQLGQPITDVISPWARPELVLGVAGLPSAAAPADGGAGRPRHWAHASVAEAMAAQCPHCVERLRQRLGPAAADLGDDPIRLPDHVLHGEQGQLGPFHWWRLPRSDGRWVTVWRLAPAGAPPLWLAHGLLQGEGPPDGRDADLALLQRSVRQLAGLVAADGPAAQLVGEQGALLGADAPLAQAAYWAALLASTRAAVARGDDEAAPALGWPGLPAGWQAHPWHAINWQRAWRQVEADVLAEPAAAEPASPPPAAPRR